MKIKKKVICAMSGGVDSSIAAALLKKQGYYVIGVFMKFWKGPGRGENSCCSSDSERRARRVAKILEIPFYVFNFEKEFKKRIVDKFLEGYRKGITPNPCVVCNKEIKFGLLLEKVLKLDADFIATGHYARLRREFSISNHRPFLQGRGPAHMNMGCGSQFLKIKLLKARDKDKDQSYFLWRLTQKQLKRILFPIGDYKRRQVEELAKKFKLPVLKARKSVEICFIPDAKTNEFLKSRIKTNKGNIVNTKGKIIGEHQGLWFFTIGQRKGIRLPGGPYFVLNKDLKKNILIVTKNENDLFKKELICNNVNWISGGKPKLPLKVKVKIRYRHQPALAIITRGLKFKAYCLKFARAQRAFTPGQSAVFYENQEILGGGIICPVRSF